MMIMEMVLLAINAERNRAREGGVKEKNWVPRNFYCVLYFNIPIKTLDN